MIREQVNEKGLREVLASLGASEVQMKAGVVELMENAMADEEITSSATAKQMLKDMLGETKQAESRLSALDRSMRSLGRDISEYKTAVESANKAINEHVIHDNGIIDGLIAYQRMLEATRDAFGEEAMTEAVVCKAVEAASYGMWRSVMGPKHDGGKKDSGRWL